MTQIFQIAALAFNLNAAPAAAQIQPCVWPKCTSVASVMQVEVVETVPAVQIVAENAENAENDVTICLYPKPCGANGAAAAAEVEIVAEDKPITTCQYPQPCSGVARIEEKI